MSDSKKNKESNIGSPHQTISSSGGQSPTKNVTISPNIIDDSYLNSLYYKPFLSHAKMTSQPSLNYLGNQGIFIPQSIENNQFFFIPGNVRESTTIPETKVNQKEGGTIFTSKESINFVPSFESSDQSSYDESDDLENFETFLVPVCIKKENDGSIELFPEHHNLNLPQPTNPEQISILKKINILKNQHLTQQMSDSFINTSTRNQEIIDNIKDETQGYVMFRFNKIKSSDNSKRIEFQSHSNIIPQNINSLMISALEKRKSLPLTGQKKSKIKRRQKAHKLNLSAVSEKLISPTQSTSRFRRLRVDDRTQCWNLSGITCIDTRMREIPKEIIKLSESNAVIIPDEIFQLLKEGPKSRGSQETIINCDHEMILDINHKGKRLKDQCKYHFWHYMCSMNNCEYNQQDKRFM